MSATLEEINAKIAEIEASQQPVVPSMLTPEQVAPINERTDKLIDQENKIKETQQQESAPRETPEEDSFMQKLDKAIPAPIAELAAAVNRGTMSMADFLSTDIVNAALQTAGVDARVPSIKETIGGEGIEGGFMEEGLPRRIVRTAGEFAAPVAATGQGIRALAQTAPKIGATLTQKVAQAASTAPSTELAGAALAGAGSEVGADVGGEIGAAVAGEEGRAAGERRGRLAGSFIAPIGGAIVKQTATGLVTKGAKKLLTEAAPTIEGLKKAARSVYRDLENSGVSVNSGSIGKLAGSLSQVARQKGFHGKIHPKVGVALNEFKLAADSGANLKLSEVDNLRRIMGAAAKSSEPDEARLGVLLSNRIDDFLDNAGKNELTKTSADIGAKYKDARQLWRRVKKSEQLAEVFDKAQLQASGFENGIRTQFRSILKNKKQRKGFTPDEIKAMREVVQGTNLQNMAKLLGRFGFGEGQASNMLMGYAGIAGGAVAGGPVGAVVVPSVGQLSRKLAQRLTREGAKNADLMIRAGKNGAEIVKAYMKITPPKHRTAQELTELLLRPDINIEGLKQAAKSMPIKSNQLVNDAVFLTNSINAAKTEAGG